MFDIIQLLPDNIANQIAAGEVIQRPASAVKELLENAVDAGATEIRLIVSDAGKSLIQVIDNGKGMSPTDARMSFERHATSKIRQIDDLFQIRTMGFRGEALASIAAVAQVELKTRRVGEQTGTYLEIDNSAVRKQEVISCAPGTNIAMKNLFFNVPARRNFLKSNASEMRHIVDEFIRVSMAFPGIFFSLSHNGQEVFHLEIGSLKQRILQLTGSSYNARLVQVQEKTDYLNIHGFVGKPDTAKKTRGDQYFFVNNRFIKSAYLNHAVMSAYQEMIPSDAYPMYVLFIDLDPAQVDVNVHPTKQEIKFEDEKIIYAFVQAAVKHSLAQFSITPTLEFDMDINIQQLDAVSKPFTNDQQQAASGSSLYKTFTQKNQAHFIERDPAGLPNWKQFYAPDTAAGTTIPSRLQHAPAEDEHRASIIPECPLLQLHQTYIVACTQTGYLLIHQQAAHERVLYERYAAALVGTGMAAQRSLFPATLDLSAQDAALLQELLPDLNQLGYVVEHFGQFSFVIQATPADVEQGNEKNAIEFLIEQYKHSSSDLRYSKREKLIRSMAFQHAIKPGKTLSAKEMEKLCHDLFTCAQPNITASGKPTYLEFKKDQLERLFDKR